MSKNRPRPIAIVARRCQRVIGRRFMRAATVGLGDVGSGAGPGVGTTGSWRPAVMAVPPRIDLMRVAVVADRGCVEDRNRGGVADTDLIGGAHRTRSSVGRGTRWGLQRGVGAYAGPVVAVRSGRRTTRPGPPRCGRLIRRFRRRWSSAPPAEWSPGSW